MSNLPGSAAKSCGSAPAATRCSARSPTTLRRRGHLDEVAEDRVGGGVHVLDLLELLAQAERDRLLAQVGQLAAGDLVAVDAAGRRGQAGLERRVEPRAPPPSRARGRTTARSDRPVVARRCGRWPRPAPTATAGWWCRPSAALAASTASTPASIAASRVASWPPAVSWVCRWTGRSNRSRSARDQRPGGGRAQQAGHVLDRQDVRARRRRSARPGAGSSRGCRASRPGRTGRRCSRARPRRRRSRSRGRRRWPAASGSTSLSASKMRKMSMPVAAASSTKASVTAVGYGRVADGVAAAQQHLQADVRARPARSAASRSHGSSARKRSATS